MERHRRIRRSTLATALGAALAVSVFAPSLAGGDVVGEVLNGLGVGSADPRAGTPPGYQPPLHGSNPHGQGTIASVDLTPSSSYPYPGNPSQGQEEVVVGESRGEQNGSTYHGRVTLVHVNLLGLINQTVGIESNPGQTNTGPTGPLNTALNNVCTGSANAVCLNVLPMSSSTTSTGSNNSFAVATFNGGAGGGSLSASAGSSSGNIQESGNCQTATGSSSVANAALVVPGLPLAQPTASVMEASSSSTACNNGQQSTTNDSNTLTLVGNGIPVPAAGCPGPNETPDTEFNTLAPVAAFVCNGDDVNQGQTSAPYGVREAFTAFAAIAAGTALVKLSVSGPESHAVAPPAAPTTPAGPGGPGGKQGPGGEGEAGEAAGEAQPGAGVLPFTGQSLLLLGLIGAGLISLGLLGISAGERRSV
jgi:hypothetical protein